MRFHCISITSALGIIVVDLFASVILKIFFSTGISIMLKRRHRCMERWWYINCTIGLLRRRRIYCSL